MDPSNYMHSNTGQQNSNEHLAESNQNHQQMSNSLPSDDGLKFEEFEQKSSRVQEIEDAERERKAAVSLRNLLHSNSSKSNMHDLSALSGF